MDIAASDDTVKTKSHYLHSIHPDAQKKSDGKYQFYKSDIFTKINNLLFKTTNTKINW
jgi:uracil DNA glycosylase